MTSRTGTRAVGAARVLRGSSSCSAGSSGSPSTTSATGRRCSTATTASTSATSHRSGWRPGSRTTIERARRVGTPWPCPLCDRCELPDGLAVVRTTATWDEHTVPRGLVAAHRVAPGMWGRLRVARGAVRFVAETDPVTDVVVVAPGQQAIPPDVRHHVELRPGTHLAIDFLGPATVPVPASRNRARTRRKHGGNTANLRSRRAPHAPCGEGQKETVWIQATRHGCSHQRHSCSS